MLQSIGEVFLQRERKPLQDGDVKVFIEDWFRRELRTDKVYCVAVKGGSASVRVGSPVLYQEVWIRRQDIIDAIMQQIGYELARVTLISEYR